MPNDRNHALAGLRGVRKYRGVLIREAAAALGVNESSYVRFEIGSRRLQVDKLFVLANLLRCSADDLHVWRSESELEAILGEAGRNDPRLPETARDELPPPPQAAPVPASVPPPPPPLAAPPANHENADDIADALEGWDTEQ